MMTVVRFNYIFNTHTFNACDAQMLFASNSPSSAKTSFHEQLCYLSTFLSITFGSFFCSRTNIKFCPFLLPIAPMLLPPLPCHHVAYACVTTLVSWLSPQSNSSDSAGSTSHPQPPETSLPHVPPQEQVCSPPTCATRACFPDGPALCLRSLLTSQAPQPLCPPQSSLPRLSSRPASPNAPPLV